MCIESKDDIRVTLYTALWPQKLVAADQSELCGRVIIYERALLSVVSGPPKT